MAALAACVLVHMGAFQSSTPKIGKQCSGPRLRCDIKWKGTDFCLQRPCVHNLALPPPEYELTKGWDLLSLSLLLCKIDIIIHNERAIQG